VNSPDVSIRQDEDKEPLMASSRAQFEWSLFRGNPQRTGNATGVAPGEKNILWTTSLPNNQYGSSPCIKDGFVYIGGSSYVRNVFSLYDNNGTVRWTSNNNGGVSSPCVSGNRVYASDVIINKVTGTKLSGSNVGYSGPLVDGNDLYLSIGKYGAINNTLMWSNESGNMASPALYQGMIYSGTNLQTIACFNSSSGNTIWDYSIGSDCWTAPAVENDRVFYHAGSKLYCLDADPSDNVDEGLNDPGNADYDLIWTRNIPGEESSPAVANGKVYCRNRVGSVYCLWASNGTQIWLKNGFGNTDIPSSVAYADGKIYFGALYQEKNGNESLICLDATDGDLLWFYENPGVTFGRFAACCSPAISNGAVYWATSNGKVIKFGSPDDIVQPTVIEVSPVDGERDVELDRKITANFSENLDPASVTIDNVVVKDSNGNIVPGAVSWTDMNYRITFTPDDNFAQGETYSVKLGTGLMDFSGNALDGNENGMTDDDGSDELIWNFTTMILANNRPTLSQAGTIPNTGFPGTDFTYSVIYADPDDEAPVYIRIYIDGDEAGQTMELNSSARPLLRDGDFTNGEEYIYVKKQFELGAHSFHINSSDGEDFVQSGSYNLPIVTSVPNTAPVLSPIPVFNVYEDITGTLDLAPDIDDDYTKIKNVIVTTNCSYARIEGVNITFNVPQGILYLNVNITVRDGDGLEGYGRLEVSVTPVNDPPQWRYIEQPIIVTEDIAYELNLSDAVFDPDDPRESLIVEANSEYVTVEGLMLTLLYPNGILHERINLSVNDLESRDYIELNVEIEPVNDLPDSIDDFNITVLDSVPETPEIENLTLEVTAPDVNDIDGDIIIYEWDFGDGKTTIKGQNAIHTYDEEGNYTITLSYTDGIVVPIKIEKKVMVRGPPKMVVDDPPANGSDDDDDPADNDDPIPDEGGEDNTKESIFSSWGYIIAAFIVLLIVTGILVIVFKPKKTEKESRIDEERIPGEIEHQGSAESDIVPLKE